MGSSVKYVGIMVANQKQRKRVLRTYQRVTPKHIKIYTFTPSSINWDQRNIVGLHYVKDALKKEAFPFPQVVYNRCYGAEYRLLRRIEKRIGKNKCFNHVNHFDKQDVYTLLSGTELNQYLPETLPFDEDNLDDLLDRHRVIYLKPTLGNRGRGVYRIEVTDAGEIHISQNYFAPMIICRDRDLYRKEVQRLIKSKTYIVQEGIACKQVKKRNFDIRVLMQRNRTGLWGVTNFISRKAHYGCFNTSLCASVAPTEEVLSHLYSSSDAGNVLQSLVDVSLKTAAHIEDEGGYHLAEFSVDFAIDSNDKIWIIELNGDPQRTLFKDLKHYQDVYRNPIRYARFLLSESH